MGMLEYANEKMNISIQNNSFCDFLCGIGEYKIPDREGLRSTDRGGILYSCIFTAYENEILLAKCFQRVCSRCLMVICFNL